MEENQGFHQEIQRERYNIVIVIVLFVIVVFLQPNSRPGSAGMFGRVRSTSSAGSSSYMKKSVLLLLDYVDINYCRCCRQISRKHQIRIDTPWLDPNKSLREQDVTEEDELLLMYRYYYNIELDR